jgi:excisionase family DNA binding protein
MTVSEISKRLRVSARHVYSLVQSGKLPAYRIGSAIRISEEQLQTYLAGCQQGAPAHGQSVELRRLRL